MSVINASKSSQVLPITTVIGKLHMLELGEVTIHMKNSYYIKTRGIMLVI